MAENDNTPDIAGLIRAAAAAHGVDPAILARIAQVESGSNPAARSNTSSASGLFQFTAPTWRQFGQGSPMDPAAASDAGARLTAANAQGLKSAGIDPTPGATYLAHFAGLGGARKVLAADPAAPVGNVLGADVVRANPFLANMSAGDLRAWADRKMGQGASNPAVGTMPAPVAVAPTGAAPTGTAPSQTGQVPVAPENAAPGNDQLLQTLQRLSAPPEQQKFAAPPSLQINFPQPPGLQRARALALAMGRERIA